MRRDTTMEELLCLRRAGLTPSSPGENPLVDSAKRYTYAVIQDMRRFVKREPRVSPIEARQHYHRIDEMLRPR